MVAFLLILSGGFEDCAEVEAGVRILVQSGSRSRLVFPAVGKETSSILIWSLDPDCHNPTENQYLEI